MSSKLRTSAPLILSTTAGLVAAGLMFVPRGDAAPLPTAYSAKASADVWHIDDLDLDFDGEVDDLDLAVSRVEGTTDASLNPRAVARAENLSGVTATGQAARRAAVSSATATSDTSSAVAGSAAAGTVPDILELQQATLNSRGRWVGDTACLPATSRLTDSRAITQGASLVATDVPEPAAGITIPIVDIEIPLPGGGGGLPLPDPGLPPIDLPGLPTELPTLPTDLPTWLPTGTELPTIPTEIPTTILPTLPTEIPTELPTILPPLPLPTDLPSLPFRQAKAVEDVTVAEVAGGAVEQHTWLAQKSADPDVRGVRSEAIGALTNASQAAVKLFDGEIELRMANQPRLTAYADGTNPGLVTWAPPTLTLLVAGQSAPVNVPADGTPVRISYSRNNQIVVSVSAGQVTDKVESPNGSVASAKASAAQITVTKATNDGEEVVLDSTLFPMSVEAKSPQGGVECRVAQIAPEEKLLGKSNGKKKDKLKLIAVPAAEGAQVKLFRVTKGKEKKVGKTVLGPTAKHVFKIKDKNGKKKTKYVAKLGATDLTLPGKASRKVR